MDCAEAIFVGAASPAIVPTDTIDPSGRRTKRDHHFSVKTVPALNPRASQQPQELHVTEGEIADCHQDFVVGAAGSLAPTVCAPETRAGAAGAHTERCANHAGGGCCRVPTWVRGVQILDGAAARGIGEPGDHDSDSAPPLLTSTRRSTDGLLSPWWPCRRGLLPRVDHRPGRVRSWLTGHAGAGTGRGCSAEVSAGPPGHCSAPRYRAGGTTVVESR